MNKSADSLKGYCKTLNVRVPFILRANKNTIKGANIDTVHVSTTVYREWQL